MSSTWNKASNESEEMSALVEPGSTAGIDQCSLMNIIGVICIGLAGFGICWFLAVQPTIDMLALSIPLELSSFYTDIGVIILFGTLAVDFFLLATAGIIYGILLRCRKRI